VGFPSADFPCSRIRHANHSSILHISSFSALTPFCPFPFLFLLFPTLLSVRYWFLLGFQCRYSISKRGFYGNREVGEKLLIKGRWKDMMTARVLSISVLNDERELVEDRGLLGAALLKVQAVDGPKTGSSDPGKLWSISFLSSKNFNSLD
jgi:hypothetical protein